MSDTLAGGEAVGAAADRGDAVLRIEGLKKYFTDDDSLIRRLRPDQSVRRVRAVDDVDLAVRAGDTLGLVGESGCGKSTLARTALQLLEPTAGSVYFEGEDLTSLSRRQLRSFRSEAQMIFQDPFSSLNPRYTVEQTITEPMAVHGVGDSDADRRERAADLVERVGLGEEHLDRYPHEFSGGQRQRVAIARALSVEPSLVVADEPVSALDVSVQARILNLLSELSEEMDLTMLFISHDLSVVRNVCDRVAVMYLGEVVEEAPTDELFADPKHPYSEVLVSSIPTPDPADSRERIELAGDVPTPIDPPSGCRFHPRCPKVVQPADWEHDQALWRRVLHFKHRVANGTVEPSALRTKLESEREGDVSAATLADELYEKHIAAGGIQDTTVDPPPGVEGPVRAAIERLVDGDRAAAVDALDEEFRTVCGEAVPRDLDADDRMVACHHHDPDVETPGPEDA
ncbi:ABC transporter ATP-binding protein [Halobacterium yunchengense]|uniref:ABC transporter ATP-binding protein n=1 Tax=Halobacterium yunchengense TaxID=3108497 RepID=UPI00300B4E22